MDAINLDYWQDELMPAITDATWDLIKHHVRATVIDFCTQTELVRVRELPINLVANQVEYELAEVVDTYIANNEIVRIHNVFSGKNQLQLRTIQQLLSEIGDLKQVGEPKYFNQPKADKILVYPVPESGSFAGLIVDVILRPTRICETIDGNVAKDYFDAIAHGTKQRIHRIPNKPYSDGAASAFFGSLYMNEVYKAKNSVDKGIGRGVLRTKAYY